MLNAGQCGPLHPEIRVGVQKAAKIVDQAAQQQKVRHGDPHPAGNAALALLQDVFDAGEFVLDALQVAHRDGARRGEHQGLAAPLEQLDA